MPNHVLGNGHILIVPPVVDLEPQPHKTRDDGAAARLRLDRRHSLARRRPLYRHWDYEWACCWIDIRIIICIMWGEGRGPFHTERFSSALAGCILCALYGLPGRVDLTMVEGMCYPATGDVVSCSPDTNVWRSYLLVLIAFERAAVAI